MGIKVNGKEFLNALPQKQYADMLLFQMENFIKKFTVVTISAIILSGITPAVQFLIGNGAGNKIDHDLIACLKHHGSWEQSYGLNSDCFLFI